MDLSIQGEKFLIFQAALLITVFTTLYLTLNLGLKRLAKRFATLGNHWRYSFIQALSPPLFTFLWMIALTLITDLIQDQLYENSYQEYLNKIYALIPLFCFTWFFFRWANQVQSFLFEGQKLKGHSIEKSKVDVIAKLFYLLLFWFLILAQLLQRILLQAFFLFLQISPLILQVFL